jgi:hypothetical protein
MKKIKKEERMPNHHEHRYYIATTKKEFVPIDERFFMTTPEIDPAYGDQSLMDDLHLRVEYAYLICQCNDIKKVVVRQEAVDN